MRADTRNPPDNQYRACLAVLSILESREGSRPTEIRSPEVDGQGAPVELVAKLGSRQFALEHTRVEAYEGQLEGGVHFENLLGPVAEKLSGLVPDSGFYELNVSVDALDGVKRHLVPKMQDKLIDWVRDKARDLDARVPEQLDRDAPTQVLWDQ